MSLKNFTKIFREPSDWCLWTKIFFQVSELKLDKFSLKDWIHPCNGIHRTECNFGHDDKKYKTDRVKYNNCDCFLEYANFKYDLIEYKCLCCNKKYQHKFDKKLKKRLFNT